MPISLLNLLKQGDRKEIGKAADITSIIIETPALMSNLIDCVVNGDETVRSHAAHALMQLAHTHIDLLHPQAHRLLDELLPLPQWEIQEQLSKFLPKLHLSDSQTQRVIHHLHKNLSHKSAIVRTCALQALFDFSQADKTLKISIKTIINRAMKHGPKSLQARARKLNKELS